MGVLKTMSCIWEAHVWPGMKTDVQFQLQKCGKCLVHNSKAERVPMGEMPMATYPGQIIGMDLFVPSLLTPMDHIMCLN